MITREQALTLDAFHEPAGTLGRPSKCYILRRNGATKTWITRPTHYRVPVKYGMYDYAYITAPEMVVLPHRGLSGEFVFAPEDCPACHGAKA